MIPKKCHGDGAEDCLSITMFTGLIEQVGQLEGGKEIPDGRELTIRANLSAELSLGQSIGVNGVCLSVTECLNGGFTVIAVPETISKTTLGKLPSGTPVNLERALRWDSRLDGHLVQGHIDTTCTITRVSTNRGGRMYEFLIPEQYAGLVVPRGSIAIDGISLTIANLKDGHISVAIIPQTYTCSNVAVWHPGTVCNFEFDILAKYAERQLSVGRRNE